MLIPKDLERVAAALPVPSQKLGFLGWSFDPGLPEVLKSWVTELPPSMP